MKMEDFDKVEMLRKKRVAVIRLQSYVRYTGSIVHCTVSGETIFPIISTDAVKKAILEECDRVRAQYEAELKELGVTVTNETG